MKLRTPLLLAIVVVLAVSALFLRQRHGAVPVGAASYTGLAQISGPLQLDLAITPPVSTPRDTLQLTATLTNRTAAQSAPTVLLALPGNVQVRVSELPRGATLNLQRNELQWLPVVAPQSAQTLDVTLRVDTADIIHPEKEVTVTLRDGENEKQAGATLWFGLPPRINGFLSPARVAVGQPLPLQLETGGPGPFTQKWSLGDGRHVAVNDPTVVYPAPGVYEVRVELSNPLGTVSRAQQITVVPHVAAQFTVSDETPGAGQMVAFQNESGGQQPVQYTWDFGDGVVSNEANPSHTYEAPGVYAVRLVAENGYGRSETNTTVTVGVPPSADILVAESAPAGELVVGEALSDGTVTQYAWDFGDGRTYNGEKVSHSYRQTGDYYVTLTARNEFGETRVGRWVRVEPGILKSYMPLVSSFGGLSGGSSVDIDSVDIALPEVELEGEFTMEPIDVPPDASPAEQLFLYINEVRRRFDLPALAYSYELSAAAQKHSDDMATYNHASHTGSDGSRPPERVLWHGYRHGYAGEATGWGFSTPKEAVEFWLNSPSHRPMLLNRYATDLGVGYTLDYGTSGIWHWTIEFGNKFAAPGTPALLVNEPQPNLSVLNTEPVTFSWNWTQPLAAGERFVVYVGNETGAVAVGSVTQPSLGMRYTLQTAVADFPALLGPLTWQVTLESGTGGELAASEARALTVNADPALPTATPLVTTTITPTVSVTPLPSAVPTETPPAIPTLPAVVQPSPTTPPLVVTATPLPPLASPTPEPSPSPSSSPSPTAAPPE